MSQTYSRLREIDFLRGIAILLVLTSHLKLFNITSKIGWIGVDLFFVLSGYLVSGLLFKEYIKTGKINPKLFLIRRGFKIYPIYYIFMIPYIGIKLYYDHKIDFTNFFYDFVFLQNYKTGWGYLCPASWSLAIEEHFYFSLCILIYILIRYYKNIFYKKYTFTFIIVTLLIIIFIIRFISNTYLLHDVNQLYTMSHLRFDSLLFGVLIAYLYYFKKEKLRNIFIKNQKALVVLAFLMLSWTPFFQPLGSEFVRIYGFTLLYLAFGIILLFFLINQNINQKLDKIFTSKIVNLTGKIGFASYSIYYIHSFFIYLYDIFYAYLLKEHDIRIKDFIGSLILFIISIFAGILITKFIEKYFLRIREKYFSVTN